jgi:3-oxoacyl-[acyl-carrier-protein] synthase II
MADLQLEVVKMNRRVVVTGIGLVTAAGLGIDETWRRIRADPPRPTLHSLYNGADDRIEFSLYKAPEYEIDEVAIPAISRAWLNAEDRKIERDQRHLLAATGLAIKDAGLEELGDWKTDTGSVACDEFPGMEPLCEALFGLGRNPAFARDIRSQFDILNSHMFNLNTFLVPYRLAKAFQLGGMCLFVNSACASALNAIDTAAAQIRRGRTERMIVAAADNPLSVAKFLWFDNLRIYARDGCIRPFDPASNGTVFGDGGGALILEELRSAEERGAKIYAEFLGAGFAQD